MQAQGASARWSGSWEHSGTTGTEAAGRGQEPLRGSESLRQSLRLRRELPALVRQKGLVPVLRKLSATPDWG